MLLEIMAGSWRSAGSTACRLDGQVLERAVHCGAGIFDAQSLCCCVDNAVALPNTQLTNCCTDVCIARWISRELAAATMKHAAAEIRGRDCCRVDKILRHVLRTAAHARAAHTNGTIDIPLIHLHVDIWALKIQQDGRKELT